MDEHGRPARVDAATAARALVWLQTYAPAGITSPTIGDERWSAVRSCRSGPGWGLRATLIMLEGETLAETILLNMPQLDSDTTSLPAPWDRGGPTTGSCPATGIDLLTWPARMVRLIPDETGMVHDLVLSAGAKIDPEQVMGLDPMTAWVKTGQAPAKPWRRTPARRPRPGRCCRTCSTRRQRHGQARPWRGSCTPRPCST